MATSLRDELAGIDAATEQRLVKVRRELHAQPELSFQEHTTAEYITEYLDRWPVDNLKDRVGGTGVVADVRGKLPGGSVLVRADMDGLPLTEAVDVPFRSQRNGVMHACGHDVHMAIALELAASLSVNRHRLPGSVRFVFQPAEEVAGGAEPMIKAGVLDGIDSVLALHVWAGLPLGQIGVRPGVIWGSADWFTIRIEGAGGHGGMPHLTVDAVVIAAQVVSALQVLVSRETSPTTAAVITIGSIHGGTAHNIVAGTVVLQGTLRAFDPSVREHLLTRMDEVASSVAGALRGRAHFERGPGAPPVASDARIAGVVAGAANLVVGADRVIAVDPMMIGEDFSYFLEQRPGCFFLLGGSPADGPRVHHTEGFEIDERCLPIGLQVMARAVLALLEPGTAQAGTHTVRDQSQA